MKGALAHKGGIELVVLSSGIVIDIQSLLWTDGGSAARLSEFFPVERNPIAIALDDLMEKLDLKLYRNCKARFLGVGGTGSVFWFCRTNGRARRGMTLKVAAGTAML